MVTKEELESAMDIMLRYVVGDDELWNEVPEALRKEAISESINDILAGFPDSTKTQLRGVLALVAREAKK